MAQDVVRYVDIRPLIQDMNQVKQEMSALNSTVGGVNHKIEKVSKDLDILNKKFAEFLEDRIRAEALAQATTELIRVRQEIEKKFGSYGLVRETMLGILQATDLALVKKATISNVSEELMISTPRYWLSPCLIAVSAWINNDRDLAERAIKEALKRDEERTALTMALICRRNGRTVACYEWLSIYFSKLNVRNFSKGGYTFVDAYINGVFGPDEKHICSDYIAKWLSAIKEGDTEFEETQKRQWKEYYISKASSQANMYPNLQEYALESKDIMDYTDRVYNGFGLIQEFDEINHIRVNVEEIKNKVDDNLIEVISHFAEEEIDLRDEEIAFQRVKASNGHRKYEEVRRQLSEQRAREQREKIDFVEQMMNAITNQGLSSPSERKTAISFLQPYINEAYREYIDEKKEAFPTGITVDINGYQVKVEEGSDISVLKNEYMAYINKKKDEEIQQYMAKAKNNYLMIAAILFGIGCLAFITGVWPVGIGFFISAAYCVHRNSKCRAYFAKNMDGIKAKYETQLNRDYRIIDDCVNEWSSLNKKISQFDTKQKYLVA